MGKHETRYSKERVTGRKGKTAGSCGICYHLGLDGILEDGETWWIRLQEYMHCDKYFREVLGIPENETIKEGYADWYSLEEDVRENLKEKEYTYADLLDNTKKVQIRAKGLPYRTAYSIVGLSNTGKVLNILAELNNTNRKMFLKDLEEHPEATYMLYNFRNTELPWLLVDDDAIYYYLINDRVNMFGILYENFYTPEND